jgi:hypothetical protein
MGVMNMTMTLDRLRANNPDTTTTALAERLTQRRTGNGGMIASLDDRERMSTKTTICKTGRKRDQSLLLRKNLEGPRIGGRKTETAIRVALSAAHIAHIATGMRVRTKQIMTWMITMQSPSQTEMTLRMRAEAAEEIEIAIETETGTETGIIIRADLDDTTKKTAKTRIERGESGRGGSVRMAVMLMKLRRSLDIDHVDISASMGMTTTRSLSMGGKGASGARQLQRQSSGSQKRIYIRWNEKRGIEKDC